MSKTTVVTKKSLIPSEHKIIGAKEELDTLSLAIKDNIPVLLIGETGVGKTSLIRHLAHEHKQPLRRVNLNGQTTVDEFVGKTLLNKEGTYWQDGVLTQSMREGYWLVLDELNAALPEILFVLHSLLDDDKYIVLTDKDGEIVRPHPNFRMFATMNPSGRYSGTKELNKALMSRFPIILQMDFPDIEEEIEIVMAYSNIDKGVVINLVKMANKIRASYNKEDIDYSCSTRDLINCAILAQKVGIAKALKFSVLNRVSEEDKKAIDTIVSVFFGLDKNEIRLDKSIELETINKDLSTEVWNLSIYLGMMATYSQGLKAIITEEKLAQNIMTKREKLLSFETRMVPNLEILSENMTTNIQSFEIKDAEVKADIEQILNHPLDSDFAPRLTKLPVKTISVLT